MPLRSGLLLVLGFLDMAMVMVLWTTFPEPQLRIRFPLEIKKNYKNNNGTEFKFHQKHQQIVNMTRLSYVNKTSTMIDGISDQIFQCLFQRRISNMCEILSSEKHENKLMYHNVHGILNSYMTNQKCWLSSLILQCERLHVAHGYNDKPVTKEELDFPLAFGIRLHRSAEQAEQLLRSIYRPHNVYCIHVDRKADDNICEIMNNISRCFKNVFVIENRETVVYTSSGVIKADLKCMHACLKSNIKWKYFLNLAGQEFPLRTNLEIVMILKIFQGDNDIESYDYPKNQEERFRKKYVSRGNNLIKTNVVKPQFGYDMQMSKGSAYGMFSRRFAEFVITDNVANELLKWLDDSSSPEETFWATLNTLPWAPGGYYVETRHSSNSHASRALIWKWDKVKCYGRFIRGVCVFGFRDLPWLKYQPHVIANKFDTDADRVVVDCLESLLLKRIHHPLLQTIDKNYFKKLPQIRFHGKVGLHVHETMKDRKEIKKNWLDDHPWRIF